MRLLTIFLSFSLGIFYAWAFARLSSDSTHNVMAQSQPETKASSPTKFCKQFKFHWLELENEKYSEAIRHIEVFMDEKAFSEANLRELFDFLSKSNPDPEGLTIVVHTDWSQFSEPSPNCPGTGCGECSSKVDPYDHLQAIYWRRPNREYFKYSPKLGVANSEFTTVVIK